MSAVATPGWATSLIADGAISESRFLEICAQTSGEDRELAKALVDAHAVLEETVAAHMAMELHVPFVDPRVYDICLDNASLISEELARRHELFPLFATGDHVTLGMADPTDLAVIDKARLRLNCQVDPCFCPPSLISALIDRAYDDAARPQAAVPVAGKPVEPEEARPRDSNKVVQLVRDMISQAARDGASDLHIEPEADILRVRARIDGILHETSIHPLDLHSQVVSRIKVEAKMDIAETRRPQDGHCTTTVNGQDVDIRVSTIPTVHGENVVMRLLPSDNEAVGLDDLNMPDGVLRTLKHALDSPNGMILVTGPTGSGKTTTLYAALQRLSTPEQNVVTVEDPVEKRLPMLRQTQVNVKAGLTFASGLRAFLRQDPDVIMVGEIRDQETAEITIQAALTGHMVLSTLHTNTAAGAVVRLSEMGIAPFLITSSLRVVLSQRLTRRICDGCRVQIQPEASMVAGFRLENEDIEFVGGVGCPRCLNTGYKGRVGVYELLQLTPGLSKALLNGSSRDAIEEEAQRALVCSLREDGLNRVREGLTTLDEVARVAGMDFENVGAS